LIFLILIMLVIWTREDPSHIMFSPLVVLLWVGKQFCRSTTEAGYMEIAEACREATWMRGLYTLLCGDISCSTIFCDSQSDICLT
jgi:hypothetical protein